MKFTLTLSGINKRTNLNFWQDISYYTPVADLSLNKRFLGFSSEQFLESF